MFYFNKGPCCKDYTVWTYKHSVSLKVYLLTCDTNTFATSLSVNIARIMSDITVNRYRM